MTKLVLDEHGGYIELLDESMAVINPTKWVTDCAAIARGKYESNNPASRYEKLHREAEAMQPSRPLEFLPVAIPEHHLTSNFDSKATHEEVYKFLRFCHISNGIVYTNGRALIEVGIRDPQPISDSSIERFAAFRAKVPMFSWAQIVTHTQLSTESQSDRMTGEHDYWLPEDLESRIFEMDGSLMPLNGFAGFLRDISKIRLIPFRSLLAKKMNNVAKDRFPKTGSEFKCWMLNNASQKEVQKFLKDSGYPREIYSRAPYYFKMKEFVITGWCNDDSAWPHFLRERGAYTKEEGIKENWTQPITKSFASAVRMLLESSGKITLTEVVESYNNLIKRRKDRGY